MTRPKIVFCYRNGLLGGVSAQLLNRYPYLSRAYDIEIIFERDSGMASRFPANVATVAGTVQAQEEAIRRAAPDLTVVLDSPTFFEAWRAAESPGRLLLEVHSTTTGTLAYLDDQASMAGVSHIVTVSDYMVKLLERRGLDKVAPISVVPNCLDEQWRTPAPHLILDHKPVLWVGKLDGHKRWRRSIELMEQLCADESLNAVPVIVGGFTAPDAEVRALTTRLASSPALSRTVWWPRLEYQQMPQLYASAGHSGGVQLCTSTNESFGMAVAESLVQGCPVIAPAVGALPELLPPAALYPAGDWATALDKVRRALTDASFHEELLVTADHARKITGPAEMMGAYERVIERVLGS